MKKALEEAKLELILFDSDIITNSQAQSGEGTDYTGDGAGLDNL